MRERVRRIVFGTDTPAGRLFDVVLIVTILASLVAVSLETVQDVRREHAELLLGLEWAFTALFTAEYLVRLWCARSHWRYALSFFGIVDLLSILPTFVALVAPGTQALLVVRVFRLLRVFRVLKLARFLGEADTLKRALLASRFKITVFLVTVLCIVTIVGALMYVIEGPEHGFTSVPRAVFWAIVTVTTVGYGTIVPVTPLGQLLAGALMITGYGILAVPTGIVSAELVHSTMESARRSGTRRCADCGADGHERDARYCRRCGAHLAAGDGDGDGEPG